MQRLGKKGVEEVLNHDFLKSIDVKKLLKKEVDPPYKPK